MGTIPSFTGNTPVQPGPLVDASPINEAYQNLFSGIEQATSGEAQELARQQTIENANIAGTNEAFAPTAGFTANQRAYNEQGLLVNKYTVGADIIQQVNQAKESALNNVTADSLDQYRSTMAALGQGYFSTVPQQNRAYVQKFLTYKATSGDVEINKALFKKQQAEKQVLLDNSYNSYLSELTNANNQGDTNAAASFHGQIASALENARVNNIISSSQYLSYKKNLDKEFYNSQATGQISGILNNDEMTPQAKIEAANQLVTSVPSNNEIQQHFSPLAIKSLQSQLNNQINQFRQQYGVAQNQLAQTKNSLIQQAYNGQTPDIDKVNMVKAVLPSDQSTAFQSELDANQLAGSNLTQIKNGTLEDAQSGLNQIMQAYQQIDWQDPNAAIEQKVLSKATADAQRLYQTKLKDPAQFIINTDAYKSAQQAVSESPTQYPAGYLPNVMLDQEKAQGYSPAQYSVMPAAQAKGIANQLNTADPVHLPALLQQLQASYGSGEAYNIALNDLNKNGLKTSPRIITAVMNNPDTTGATADLITALKTPSTQWPKVLDLLKSHGTYKQLQANVTNNLAPTISALQSQGLISPQQYSHIQQATTSLAAQYVYADNMSYGDASAKAAKMTLLDHYNVGNLNSHSFVVPTYDQSNNPIDLGRTNAIAKMTLGEASKNPQIVVQNNWNPNIIGDSQRLHYYQQELKAMGYWANKGNDQLMLMDGEGKPVLQRQKGQITPITINFNDVGNPSSNINLQLNAHLKNQVNQAQSLSILNTLSPLTDTRQIQARTEQRDLAKDQP